MKTPTLIAGVLSSLAAFAPIANAQATAPSKTIPAEYEKLDASGQSFFILSPFEARRQLIIDQRHLTAFLGKSIKCLQVRRNLDTDDLAEGQYHLDITMSQTTVPPERAFLRFASNHGPSKTIVFSGIQKTKKAKGNHKGSVPWDNSNAPKINFTTDFIYSGGHICIEIVTRTVIDPLLGTSLSSWWPVDTSVHQAGGSAQSIGTSCIRGLSGTPASAITQSLQIGSSAEFSLRGTHSAGTILCAIGFDRTNAGMLPLPLDLSPFGASGCTLYTNIVLTLPAASKRLPQSSIDIACASLPVPFIPGLAGLSLSSQWLAIDSAENSLGISMSNAVNCQIGPLATHPGVTWIENTSLLAQTGHVLGGRVPVIRFETR